MAATSLDHLLALAGRLDEASGFDTARERFRRFLLDRDDGVLSALVAQCQYAPGEQHHRALQDLVALLGRPLGFDAAFGAYAPSSSMTGGLEYGVARWRSPTAVMLVDVRTAHNCGEDLPTIAASFARRFGGQQTDGRVRGLVVIAPSTSRPRIVEALAVAAPPIPVAIAALRTITALATLASSGRVTHEEIVRLFVEGVPLDFVVELLERPRDAQAPASDVRETARATDAALPASDASVHWLATVVPEYGMTPDQFLRVVVARRLIFGVPETGAVAAARPGDIVCFYIVGKGVVGHAGIQAIDVGSTSLRDAHRYRQVLRLQDLGLRLDAPVPLDAESELRLRASPAPSGRQGHGLVRISSASFDLLTNPIEPGERGPADPPAVEVIAATPEGAAPTESRQRA